MSFWKGSRTRAGALTGNFFENGPRVETYPLESVQAAGKMAEKKGDNTQERANYSRVLVEESRNLGAYIVRKSTRAVKAAG